MILLSAKQVQKSFGMHDVLTDITFSLQKGEKMGLIGSNGCGKTTLMRIIAGETTADGGQVHRNKELRIGYLAQIDDISPDDTVWTALLRVFASVIAISERLTELEAEMTLADETKNILLSSEYQRLTEQFNRMEGYAYEGEMQRVLQGLGLPEIFRDRKVSTLSGGERTRLSLAKLLLQKPDVILMDEPTNHLDLAAIEWLQDYLVQYKGSLLLISHDRYFLDHVCNAMGEIIGGKLMKFTGNYTEYQKKRAMDFEARMKAFSLQQKEIEREMAIIQRYRSFNREKSIKAAESRQKRLDKIERLERPPEEQNIRFSFQARRRSGEDVLICKNLCKSFEHKTLFQNIHFSLRAGDRVALIGANGIGKSTLFQILLNRMPTDAGTVTYGANVDIGYYDQHQQTLNLNNSVLDEVWNQFPTMEQTKVRSALSLFLFTGDDVCSPISDLSGGERGRVALTKLMLKQDNLLLLDEPTNHLDMDSREVLEEALYDFEGTILAVSHDRYFINRFANRIMVLEADGLVEYPGNFDDYMHKRNQPTPPNTVNDVQLTKTAQIKDRKKERKLQAQLRILESAVKQLEQSIMVNEEDIATLEKQMEDPATYADSALLRNVTDQYQQAQEKMETLYEALQQAEDDVTAFENNQMSEN